MTQDAAYPRLVLATDGLLAYWRLGEAAGERAQDAAGRYPATYENVALGPLGAIAGDDDTAAEFDGASSAVVVNESGELSFEGTAPFSLDAWIRPRGLPRENTRILSRLDGDAQDGVHGYELILTPRGTLTFNRHRGQDVDHVVSGEIVLGGAWTHVAASYDGAHMRVYANGKLVAEREAAIAMTAPSGACLNIGRRSGVGGSSTFDGLIDEVAVTARALDAEELHARCAAAGRGRLNGAAGAPFDALWSATVKPLLAQKLWTQTAGYDACQYLMLPLHAAFELRRDDWISQFAGHASRLIEAELDFESPLARLTYLLLWSRFMALAVAAGRDDVVPDALPPLLFAELSGRWEDERAGLLATIARAPVGESWRRSISDSPLFLMAMAADLWAVAGTLEPGARELLEDARGLGVRVFASETRWTDDGGWLFQPGVWHDHPDFVYAGRSQIEPAMEDARIPDIAGDTSHAHRLPVLLESLRSAFAPEEAGRRFYDSLRAGLERQFVGRVLVEPDHSFPAPRTTNFMDGRNGLYRYGFYTLGEGHGYGPYELSGTLTLGWWSRLPGRRIRRVYRDLAASFPLREDVVATYSGPPTTRPRPALCTEPAAFTNGFRELLINLAATLEPPDGDAR